MREDVLQGARLAVAFCIGGLVVLATAPWSPDEKWSQEAIERDIARCVSSGAYDTERSEKVCRNIAIGKCVNERDDWKDCYRWAGEPVPEYLPKP